MTGLIYISLENKNITVNGDSAITIQGIYNKIEGNHRKAICFTDIVIDEEERANAIVSLQLVGGDYQGVIGIGETNAIEVITITSDNEVQVTTI